MNPSSGAPLPPGIGKPALRALAAVGVTRLEQAAALSDRELSALHGVGPKAVRLLREAAQRPAAPERPAER